MAVSTPPTISGLPESYKGCGLVTSWRYVDHTGEQVLAVVARYENGSGDKQVIPFLPNSDGWRVKAPDTPRPLFGLDRLPDDPASTVYVCEGEKCAQAMHYLDLPAVTSMGGSGSALKADWSPLRHFRHVVVLRDNDKPGEHYARDVTRELARFEGQCKVEIARLPGVPEHGDVVDWLQAQVPGWGGYMPFSAGVDVDDLREGLINTMREVAEAVPMAWLSPADFEVFSPIPDDLSPVVALTDDMLPELLRPWLLDVAARIGCPVDFPAAAAIVVAGALIGRQVAIRPRRHDDWACVPNLWGGVVGRPGVLKTPALGEVLKPLRALEAKAREQHVKAMERHKVETDIYKAECEQRKKDVRKAMAKSGGREKARAMLEEAGEPPEEPVLRRYSTQDTTAEKLGDLLSSNPNGMLVFRDELAGFLRGLERDGQECARSFYLEAWDGRSGFTFDRIGRGTIHIPHAVVGVFGSIQPGPLRAYLAENTTGAGADGLLQRFQVLVWPDVNGPWRDVDRWPEKAARNQAYRALEQLADINPVSIGAQTDDYDDLPFVRFDAEAQAMFNGWRADLEARVRAGDLPEIFEAVLSKYRSLVPSLALIFHLVDGKAGHVTVEHLDMALQWAEYLESHAQRVYAVALDAQTHAARLLWQRIEKGELDTPFTARDLKRKHWSGLSSDKAVEGALKTLELHGYLGREKQKTGGRDKELWHVNPEAKNCAPLE